MFVVISPFSSCLCTTPPLGNCQFAQAAISPLDLPKQITCCRSQPKTEPSPVPEMLRTQWAPSAVVSAASYACIMGEELLSCSISLIGTLHALVFACPTLIWHFIWKNRGLATCLSCCLFEQGLGCNSPAGILYIVRSERETCSATGAVGSRWAITQGASLRSCCREHGGFREGGGTTIGTICHSHL